MKKKKLAPAPIALRTPEAALASGISERTIQRLIKSRELPSVRIGKIRLIRKESLDKFLASREEASAS
jgi:excisionase family DNA binding protein